MSSPIIASSERPVTLQDVAERAGVSKMAVSAVLSGRRSTVGVSEATRERIRQAATDLGYRPNAFARSLRSNRTNTIGFYNGSGIVDAADPFMRELFHALQNALAAHGMDLMVYTGLFMHSRASVFERVFGNKTDGIVVLPTPDDASIIELLRSKRTPAVTMVESIPGVVSVTADDAGGSRMIARRLLTLGHRHILYRRSYTEHRFEAVRFESFASEISAAGGTVAAVRSANLRDGIMAEEAEMLLDRKGARQVTAAACWRDQSAMRVAEFLAAQGVVVPAQIAVTGFGGEEYQSDQGGGFLTTVDAHWFEVARTAVDILMGMLSGGPESAAQVVIPASLCLGESA